MGNLNTYVLFNKVCDIGIQESYNYIGALGRYITVSCTTLQALAIHRDLDVHFINFAMLIKGIAIKYVYL